MFAVTWPSFFYPSLSLSGFLGVHSIVGDLTGLLIRINPCRCYDWAV